VKAIIISIGDELILGQTVDTNAAWLSNELAAIGITVIEHLTLADDLEVIVKHLQHGAENADVILATGGLGPTEDDLTRHALADVLDQKLQLHEPSLGRIEQFFSRINRAMAPTNRIQAMIPTGCEVIDNELGTAPGLYSKIGKAAAFFFPGVPAEMKNMFTNFVVAKLKEKFKTQPSPGVIITRTLHTVGTGESDLAEIIGDLMGRACNPTVNTTAKAGQVSIRINARAEDDSAARKLIVPIEQQLRDRLGNLIFGYDDETLPQVVGRMLREQGQTLAVAESCTGGLLAQELTDTAGSSDYFKCGWVTYSNQTKVDLLQVDKTIIDKFGAVSEEVAQQLASNARRLGDSDYAIGITGIAGPTGGSTDKPVGLVYIGLADKNDVTVKRQVFPGDRTIVRRRAVITALDILRKRLL
jgi:nicotinamide-nucleotide amidase